MKIRDGVAGVALLALVMAPGSCGVSPVPVSPVPGNLVVHLGWKLTNNQTEPIGGRVHVVIDARDEAGVALGPDHIDQTVRNDAQNAYGTISREDGTWDYAIGIGPKAGSVTLSIKVSYIASPNEIVSCYISSAAGGLGQVYDDEFRQTGGRGGVLEPTCAAVVTN